MGKRRDPDYLFAFGPEELAEWWGRALCNGHKEPDNWFAEGASERLKAEAARNTCKVCPVATKCLSYAMSHDVEGIWGGLTYKERRELRGAPVEPVALPDGPMCPKGLHDMRVHGRHRTRIGKRGLPTSNGVRCTLCESANQRARRAAQKGKAA